MIEARLSPQERVRALREDFDRSFSLAPSQELEGFESFIAVRLGGDPYLLRIHDVAALATRPRIVPLPSRRPEFLGLTSHGGSLAALFSLSLLLGYGRSSSPARWFILTRQANTLALGLEEYDGYARVRISELHAVSEAAQRPFAVQAAGHAGGVRLIVDVPRIVQALSSGK